MDHLVQCVGLYAGNEEDAFAIPYTIFRICVPYGNVLSDDYSYGTIGFFLRMAREGKPITLYGDGLQRRTFTHVQDVCNACIRVADRNDIGSGVFNIGGEPFSLYDAALMIAQKFGTTVESADWPDATLKLESGGTVFDDAKLVKATGDYRMNDFESWLASKFSSLSTNLRE